MKVALTIAGSDSSGGAGIQADLKTFEYFGVFGSSIITVLTAQNTCSVDAIYEVSPKFIKQQIRSVLKDFDVAAIKIGMLYSSEIIEIVLEALQDIDTPIVLDTVAVTNAGDTLLLPEALESLKKLIKIATIITPNRRELRLLLNSKEEIDAQYIYTKCFEIRQMLGADIYAKNFMDENQSIDYLITQNGLEKIETKYIDSDNTHGSGCTLSSAIAANLARGKGLLESCEIAKRYITSAIESAPNLGRCGGPLRHNLHGR